MSRCRASGAELAPQLFEALAQLGELALEPLDALHEPVGGGRRGLGRAGSGAAGSGAAGPSAGSETTAWAGAIAGAGATAAAGAPSPPSSRPPPSSWR